MPRKKNAFQRCIHKLPLPKWKNTESGKSVYLFALGWIGQLMALGCSYWNIEDKVDGSVIPLTVFGCCELEDKKSGKIIDTKEYYQPKRLMTFIIFCVFWAMTINMLCLLFAVKSALRPNRSDVKTLPKVATLGFFGFLFGILSMAQFSPGEAGDVAHLGVGFWGQTCGLMLMLGGVIVQFDAGSAVNFRRQMLQISPA
jgi:hypothetical protein